jgi:hypothetical protein
MYSDKLKFKWRMALLGAWLYVFTVSALVIIYI